MNNLGLKKDSWRNGNERIRNVKVTEMSVHEAEALLFKYRPDLSPDIPEQEKPDDWQPTAWAEHMSAISHNRSLKAGFRKRSTKAFLLEWEGGRSPDGVVVGKDTIVGIRGGRIQFADNLSTIGIYERIASGGGKRDIQKIVIFAY